MTAYSLFVGAGCGYKKIFIQVKYMELSKQALELIKKLASETPITVTGNTINEAQQVLSEIIMWAKEKLKS